MINISSAEATRYTNLLVGAQIRKTFLENKPQQDKFGRLKIIPENFHSEIEKIGYCDIDTIKDIIDQYLDENEKIKAFFEPEELQILSNVTDSNVEEIRELLIERFEIVRNNEITLINWFCERLKSVYKEVFERLSFSLKPYLDQYIEQKIELDSKTKEVLINNIDFTLLPWRSDLFNKLKRKHRDKDEVSILEFINENELKYIRRLSCIKGEIIKKNTSGLDSYIYWDGDESIKKPYQNIALKSPVLYKKSNFEYIENTSDKDEDYSENYMEGKSDDVIVDDDLVSKIAERQIERSEIDLINLESLDSYQKFKKSIDLMQNFQHKEVMFKIIDFFEKTKNLKSDMYDVRHGHHKFNFNYLEKAIGVDRRKIQAIIEENRPFFSKIKEVWGF